MKIHFPILSAAATVLVGLLSNSAAVAEVDPALHGKLPPEYADGVTIAVYNDWAPDEFIDEDGNLAGWSVDLARAVEDLLGVPFEYVGTSFEGIIPGLLSKRYDAGFSSFGVTPERLETLDFVPQRLVGTSFAIPVKSELMISEREDVCGVIVAVQQGTWDEQTLEKLNTDTCEAQDLAPVQIQRHSNQTQAELAVRSGRAQASFASSAKMGYLAQQSKLFRVSDLVIDPVYSSIGIRKDDALGPILRDAIQILIENGTYTEIMTKWGLDTQGNLPEALLITEENGESILGQ